MKTPEQIAAETAEKISANLCAPSDYPLPPSSVKDRCRPFILAALTEHAKGLEEKAHGFKLCFPYETIGNMNPALFKDGSYHYYVPEAERDQLRAEVERLQKAKINHFTDEHTKPHSLDDATMREWDLANKVAELRDRVSEQDDRISWLETQREEECKQKLAALNESEICLKETKQLRAELADLRRDRELYHQLLFAVVRKFPNETRHQTALRYLREVEEYPGSEHDAPLIDQSRAKDAKTEGGV